MQEPSLNQIIEAHDRCAQIIVRYGAQYLPIFERLESEIEKRITEQATIERVIRIAKNGTKNDTQIGTQEDRECHQII